MTVGESQVYRDLKRFKPEGLTLNAWAVKAGVSRTVWADMRRHGNPSRRTLEKLLAAAGSSLAEFEALRVGDEALRATPTDEGGRVGDARGWAWSPARLPPLPLLATGLAGEWGGPGSRIELTELRGDELLDRLPRPPSLAGDPDAYAVTIVGDSMWPRFRPGRRVAVSPRSPVAIGDDVLVRLGAEAGQGGDDVLVRLRAEAGQGGGRMALIKELVKRTGAFAELRQFNPDLTFRVDAADVEDIHKVVGELF